MSEEEPKVLVVDLENDPIWEIGDIRLLSIFVTGEKQPTPMEYRVTARKRTDDQVRYELKPY